MARSIHTTRRHLEEAERSEYADVQERAARLKDLREELALKRRIKEFVQEGRRHEKPPLPTLPEDIPIRVFGESPFVHYPASPDDLRYVMKLLPPGVLDGLSEIRLVLGAERQVARCETMKPDPYVGRRGWKSLEGVFMGDILGTYYPDTAAIDLCAHVYDANLPNREMWEVYLRLNMLSTFVHEVAHHFDHTERVARGRWRADDADIHEAKGEWPEFLHAVKQAMRVRIKMRDAWGFRRRYEDLARAYFQLGNMERFGSILAKLESHEGFLAREGAKRLRKLAESRTKSLE